MGAPATPCAVLSLCYYRVHVFLEAWEQGPDVVNFDRHVGKEAWLSCEHTAIRGECSVFSGLSGLGEKSFMTVSEIGSV